MDPYAVPPSYQIPRGGAMPPTAVAGVHGGLNTEQSHGDFGADMEAAIDEVFAVETRPRRDHIGRHGTARARTQPQRTAAVEADTSAVEGVTPAGECRAQSRSGRRNSALRFLKSQSSRLSGVLEMAERFKRKRKDDSSPARIEVPRTSSPARPLAARAAAAAAVPPPHHDVEVGPDPITHEVRTSQLMTPPLPTPGDIEIQQRVDRFNEQFGMTRAESFWETFFRLERENGDLRQENADLQRLTDSMRTERANLQSQLREAQEFANLQTAFARHVFDLNEVVCREASRRATAGLGRR